MQSQMKSVSSFYPAVVLGLGGRQHHKGDVHRSTGGLKVRHKLGATIDLEAEDGERADFSEFFEELSG